MLGLVAWVLVIAGVESGPAIESALLNVGSVVNREVVA
jgi:hypothetical protein